MNSRQIIGFGNIVLLLFIINSSVFSQKKNTILVNSNAFVLYDSYSVRELIGLGINYQRCIWTKNQFTGNIEVGVGINSKSSEALLFDKHGMVSLYIGYNKSQSTLYSGFGIFSSFLLPTMVNYAIGYQYRNNKSMVFRIYVVQPIWFSYQYQIHDNLYVKTKDVWIWDSLGNINIINIGIGYTF